ncbi:hypothetical protein [Nocardioides abyssi]|uniref:Uncharacterized protein n=1 Tax=Nocardioides abyssi TaxID=3058370 RepID=A0ABT8ESE3_9ACTN|nr:hypothetical protein [Nocardioides abyssi]MDN4161070.1 hypothetical protein [Nocardioides abyssi]
MSENAYLVWLVAMAVMTVVVLTVGTLIASGIIPVGRDSRDAQRPGAGDRTQADADPGRQHESTRRAA